MVNGPKFDHIAKEGFLQTSSNDFEDLVTIALPADFGKVFYAKGWVLGNDGAGGLFVKKFSQIGRGNNLLSIPGTEASNSVNTTSVTPDSEVIVHGRVVKLRVSANFADIGFYGRLEVHGAMRQING
jgi:hypothetical protein